MQLVDGIDDPSNLILDTKDVCSAVFMADNQHHH